jgi:hypothetical protein
MFSIYLYGLKYNYLSFSIGLDLPIVKLFLLDSKIDFKYFS